MNRFFQVRVFDISRHVDRIRSKLAGIFFVEPSIGYPQKKCEQFVQVSGEPGAHRAFWGQPFCSNFKNCASSLRSWLMVIWALDFATSMYVYGIVP